MLTKKEQRLRRARQTRIRIAQQGVARLTVNRTNLHIYASVVSGDGSKVLASASTAEADVRKELGASGKGGNANAAQIMANASLKKRKLLVLKKWLLTAQVLHSTVVSKLWLKPLAKLACSSKRIGNYKWLSFRQKHKVTVQKTVCARR